MVPGGLPATWCPPALRTRPASLRHARSLPSSNQHPRRPLHLPTPPPPQVLLLEGPADLPHLRNRLALVLDHDQDVDVANDAHARAAYADKVGSWVHASSRLAYVFVLHIMWHSAGKLEAKPRSLLCLMRRSPWRSPTALLPFFTARP